MSATRPLPTPGLSTTRKPPAPTPTAEGIDPSTGLPPLKPGPAAEALMRVWQGYPLVVVKSPPGAGKSTLIGTVVSHLANRSSLTVTIATPTRAQAISTLWKMCDLIAPEKINFLVSNVDKVQLPHKYRTRNTRSAKTPKVNIVTVAGLAYRNGLAHDVLVVDEAYQVTKAQFVHAARDADQLLLVGDPGQIDPVVTVDTSIFRGQIRPHARTPDVLERRSDALKIEMPCTYRLGPRTAAAIAPLYNFDFRSARPERRIESLDEIEPRLIARPEAPYDLAAMTVVADRVESLIGRTVTSVDNDGTSTTKEITSKDVAVVVTHNTQVSTVKSLLTNRGLEAVVVGTADRLQGGEWEAVVAVDPFVGYTAGTVGAHALSLGRLCVMASRHRTHLTYVHDGGWQSILADDQVGLLSSKDSKTAIEVRRRLTATR